MAKCATCGKTTTFGHNRSFSMRATRRKFEPNLQRVRVLQGGRLVQKTLCTKCIKLLTNDTGEVTGVAAQGNKGRFNIKARGVVESNGQNRNRKRVWRNHTRGRHHQRTCK